MPINLYDPSPERKPVEGGLLMPSLPGWYSRQQALEDLTALYSGQRRTPVPVNAARVRREYGYDQETTIVRDIIKTTRALRRFAGSWIGRGLRATADGDPVAAAKATLELLHWAEQKDPEGNPAPAPGGNGIAQAIANALGAAPPPGAKPLPGGLRGDNGGPLPQTLRDLAKDLGKGGADSAPETGSGDPAAGAGSASLDLQALGNGLRLRPLINALRLKYRRAGVRGHRREPVLFPEDDIDLRPARIGELPILLDLILDDDEFYDRLARDEVRALQHLKVSGDLESRTYAIGIDVSASMRARYGNWSGQEYAIASAVALLEQTLRGGHRVVLHFFDAGVKAPISGKPVDMVRVLLTVPFTGGGTAFTPVLSALGSSGCDEAILITDGAAADVPHEGIAPPLYSIFVGPGSNEPLRRISRSYEEVPVLT